eukprot:6457543-Amphidinium_carterae.2
MSWHWRYSCHGMLHSIQEVNTTQNPNLNEDAPAPNSTAMVGDSSQLCSEKCVEQGLLEG